ncbi:DNA-binding protein [Vibrio galatheae]|uniref:DNA-binding protein n=1 Tax=Vibrio galatheae TaxID=579748 RepID=A0A0F4NJV7_9VIBR|nr:PPC domain-containing DNA-binding protein [Vibrio galatheae]KJY83189.1 DNA-binding protein [Vibrio galatheae]
MITPIAVRLTKGQDLKLYIQQLVTEHNIHAGTIASCVGCFTQTTMRLAGATDTLQLHELVEIVSVMGTLTAEHQHIHIAVAKKDGSVVGGHLMAGCLVDTTVELILHRYDNHNFSREYDQSTGFTELVVSKAL